VLDIGCGAGSNVLFLAKKGYRAHGVDLSPGAVAASRARAAAARLTVDVREGDALVLPFPDATLDAVIDIGCFHTVPFARRKKYAREVYRVLRPEGSFVLSWVAREHTADHGPPHRPSLGEMTDVFESRFLFVRTGFRPSPEEGEPSTYFAFLVRRSVLQPPRR
jgi:SAM-dependent methyltransferase